MRHFSPSTRWACVVALALVFATSALADDAPRNPELPKAWMEPTFSFDRAAISPDGKAVALRHRNTDEPVTFFHRDTGKGFWRLADCGGYLFAFTPDGKHFLTQAGREVRVREVATRRILRTFDVRRPHYRASDRQCYGVGNKVLVAVGEDDLISSYDLTTGKLLGNFAKKDHSPVMVALSKDGKWLLTVSKKDDLCVWDVEKRTLFSELREHTAKVAAIAISADGKWCASVTQQGPGARRLYVFDREKEAEKARTDLLLSPNEVCFTPDGKTLLVTGSGAHHGLNVWDWQASKEIRGGLPSTEVIDRIFGEPEFMSKKWNHSTQRLLGITDKGELLTWGSSPKSRNGRVLRLWFDETQKKTPAPKDQKPSDNPKPKR